MPEDDGAPRTLRDYLTQEAEKLGIPASLALSMTHQESRGKQAAVSNKGAIGLMQLMPDTAKGLGVDPHDPFQNIQGGLRYFKEQLDANNQDVRLALAAYNAGPGRIVNGQVPNIPETQDYVKRILTMWQQGGPPTGATPLAAAKQSTAPPLAATAGMLPPSTETFDPALPKGRVIQGAGPSPLQQAIDPYYPEGRENIGGMAGAAATVALTKGLPVSGVLPWVARALAGPVGAAAGGAAAAASSGRDPVEAAEQQFTMDALGRWVLSPVVATVGKHLVAPRVARAASERLQRLADATESSSDDLIRQSRDAMAESVRATRRATRAETREASEQAGTYVTGSERFAEGQIDDAKRLAASQTADAQAAATRGVTAAETAAAQRVATVEAETADRLGRLQREYQEVLTVPDAEGVIGPVEKVLGGTRGNLHLPVGPAKRALDFIGKQVEQAAEDSTKLVPLRPLQDELRQLAQGHTPGFLAGAPPARAVGSGATSATDLLASARRRPDMMPAAPSRRMLSSDQIAAEQAAILQSLGELPPDSKLPGLLGKVLGATDDSISLLDAHLLKVELDRAVQWDRKATRTVEAVTKAFRSKLRTAMSGDVAYDAAAKAYQKADALYTTGLGKRLIRSVRQDPDAVLTILEQAKGPRGAQQLKSLLVDQAALGGDAAAGQQAWQGLVDAHARRKIAGGGLDGLADRVKYFTVGEGREIGRVLYGDEAGAKLLSNYARLGEASDIAAAALKSAPKAAKAAGEQAVEAAKVGGRETVQATKAAGADQVQGVTQIAERGVGDAKVIAERQRWGAQERARQTIEAARARGESGVRAAQDFKRQSMQDVAGEAEEFAGSTLKSFAPAGAGERYGADAWRIAANLYTHPSGYLTGLSIYRVLTQPVKSADLLKYVASDTKLTQRVVQALLGQANPTATTALLRMLSAEEKAKTEPPAP